MFQKENEKKEIINFSGPSTEKNTILIGEFNPFKHEHAREMFCNEINKKYNEKAAQIGPLTE